MFTAVNLLLVVTFLEKKLFTLKKNSPPPLLLLLLYLDKESNNKHTHFVKEGHHLFIFTNSERFNLKIYFKTQLSQQFLQTINNSPRIKHFLNPSL